MAFTKRIVEIPTILENGQIQLQTDTIIEEDGIELFRQHHRKVLSPDDDTTNETDYMKSIIAVIWTDEVKKRYIDKKKSTPLIGEVLNGKSSEETSRTGPS